MARTIRIDDEAYKELQQHAEPFEPVWKAARRALELEVPPEGTSLADFEEEQTEETEETPA